MSHNSRASQALPYAHGNISLVLTLRQLFREMQSRGGGGGVQGYPC